ncbi:MAG TPA: hypothetical protein VMB24_05685 [Dehalococcoidales bacterium]|nr:hypothetical protein [Dehalococcoidales bacterium]
MQKVFICVPLLKAEPKPAVLKEPPRIDPLVLPLSSPLPPNSPIPTSKPEVLGPAPLTHNVLMHRFRLTHPEPVEALTELLLVPPTP